MVIDIDRITIGGALHLFVFGGKSEKFVSISSWILLNFFIVSLLLFLFLHKKVLIFHHFIDVELVVLLLKTWMHLTFLLLIYLRLFLLSSNSCHSELFCIAWPGVGVCSIGLLSKVLLVLKLEQWKLRNGPSGWACESLVARYFICKMVFRNIWYLR